MNNDVFQIIVTLTGHCIRYGDGLKERSHADNTAVEMQQFGCIHSQTLQDNRAAESKGKTKYRIPSPNVTRWNSQYRMINANHLRQEYPTLLITVCEVLGSSIKFRDGQNYTARALTPPKTISGCH